MSQVNSIRISVSNASYSQFYLMILCHLLTGDCPNITCFRCGEFGHHSKACYNSRKTSRAYICTICASSTHDSKHCMQLPEKALARMVDSSIRCMQCNKLGHALCEAESQVKKKKPRLVTPPRRVKPSILSPPQPSQYTTCSSYTIFKIKYSSLCLIFSEQSFLS
jgi:hypothetical protein